MKKTLTALLAVFMVSALISIPVIADTQTTTLTTTVPEAQYTMTVPETLDIEFGTLKKDIGKLDVTAVSGFNTGKNVQVTVTHDDLAAEGKSTKIPYTLRADIYNYDKPYTTITTPTGTGTSGPYSANFNDNSVKTLLFKSNSEKKLSPVKNPSDSFLDASYHFELFASFSADDWGKALAGDYTTTITFVAEIVAEEAAE